MSARQRTSSTWINGLKTTPSFDWNRIMTTHPLRANYRYDGKFFSDIVLRKEQKNNINSSNIPNKAHSHTAISLGLIPEPSIYADMAASDELGGVRGEVNWTETLPSIDRRQEERHWSVDEGEETWVW